MLPNLSKTFLAYIEPAREKSQFWRTLLGSVLIGLVYLLLVIAAIFGIVFVAESKSPGLGTQLMLELQSGNTIFATFGALGSIVFFIPALWLVVRFLHKRPLRSLISPNLRVNWRQWFTAVVVVLGIGAIGAAMTLSTAEVNQQIPLTEWLFWLVPMLAMLFLQTTTEELVFRGYLMQQLAARFNSRIIWWVIPAMLFGSMHYNPAMFGGNVWLIVGATGLMGLTLGDLTVRTGSLSAAMGVHFANNLIVLLLLNSEGQMSGVSLFLYETDLQSAAFRTEVYVSSAVMVVCYAIFLMIMRRRRL